MGLLRALYRPDRSLLRERLRWRSLLRLRFLSRLRLLFLPFFLSLLLLLLFLEPGLRLLLRLLFFLEINKNMKTHVTTVLMCLCKVNNSKLQTHTLIKIPHNQNLLFVLVVMSVSMRGLDLILSKVDRRTS